MTPEHIDFLFFAGVVALFTAALLVFAFVLVEKGGALLRVLIAWTRRTFGRTGDQTCTNCRTWHRPVYCLVCQQTKMLRPAETVETPADILDRSRVLPFEDRIRTDGATALERDRLMRMPTGKRVN
jgi:hypothetical protein